MAFSLGDAIVEIKADTKGLGPTLGQARSMIGGVGGAFTKAIGPVLAWVGATLTIKKSIQLFFEAEQAAKGLEAALRSTGQNVKQLMPAFQEWASLLQKVSRVGDDETLALLKQATNYGLLGEQAKEATRAAIGLSTAFGIDRETALKLIAQATQGNTEALGRYIPALKGVTDQTKAMQLINEAARRGLEQEAELTNTASGKWEQFVNILGDAGETLGELIAGRGGSFLDFLIGLTQQFIDGVRIAIEWRDSIVDSFNGASASAGGFFGVIKSVFSGIASVISTQFFLIANLDLVFAVLAEAASNAFTSIVARAQWLGNSVMKVGSWMLENWQGIFVDMANLATTIMGNIAENIRRFFVGAFEAMSSRGKKGFEEGFKGLTEGFVSTVEPLALDAFVDPDLKTDAADTFREAFKIWNQAGDEAAKQTAKTMEAAKEELTKPVNVKLDPNRPDKGKKDKSSDAGQFKDLVSAWKDAQSAILKKADKVPEQQLKAAEDAVAEQKKMNEQLAEIARNRGQVAVFA